MPDWDKLESSLDEIIKKTSKETDEELASKISSVTRLTDDEIQELFPKPSDVKTLFDLMKILKSAEDRNTKINSIIENSEKFGGIVLTLLSKFA